MTTERTELRPARLRLGASLTLVGLTLGACRSTATPSPGAAPGAPLPLGPPVQVLLRAEARSDGESARLRLTLRYWDRERFELRASDLLGRAVWTLAAASELGLWRDLREQHSCRFTATDRVRLEGVSLPLPSRALPAVLLGEPPAQPPDSRQLTPAGAGGSRVEFVDRDGRRWRMRLDRDGELLAWQLEEQGVVRLEWERSGESRWLRSHEPELEIEWREVAREPLVAPAPDLATAAREVPECANGHLS